MTILETLLLALSLCADCFAVSLCSSVTLKKAGWRDVLLTALAFAVIQSALLLAGCLLGDLFYGLVETVSGIIGFVLLAYVGGSMLVEGIRGCGEGKNLDGWKNILLGGVATSIDALAVGITFAFLEVSILPAVCFIAATTFLLSCIGVKVGNLCGTRFQSKAELLGGIILILLGLKILLEHLGVL